MAEPGQRRTETRQRILDAAGRLFRQHGIDGVGVDSVMKEAGLTHGGFYLHFRSKEALAAEVAQALLENAAGRWDTISRGDDRQAALRQIVHYYLDPDAALHGCPLTTLGPDLARRVPSKHAVGGALQAMLAALARVVPGRGREKALVTLSTMVGAVVLARLADDPALAKAFLESAEASILSAGKQGAADPVAADPVKE
jgi:TetR/AcrR family transcriptional repressor of nem operon